MTGPVIAGAPGEGVLQLGRWYAESLAAPLIVAVVHPAPAALGSGRVDAEWVADRHRAAQHIIDGARQLLEKHPERAVGWHWSNPPQLIPMNEVIVGERTSPETVAAIEQLTRDIGYVPVTLKKEVPGFVENRILYALLRERSMRDWRVRFFVRDKFQKTFACLCA